MTLPQFTDLVERMRAKQIEYFRTRKSDVLKESKELEAAVDKEIVKMKNNSSETTLNLF